MVPKNFSYENLLPLLPKKPDILGRRHYLNSVVLVPFCEVDGTWNLVFQKRAAGIRQGGEICFPGGVFDSTADDSFQDTAIRETIEELGISKDVIRIDGRMDTLVASFGTIIDIFVGRLLIENLTELDPNPQEVETVFTVPFNYFVESPPKIYHIRFEAQPHSIAENGEKIVHFPTKELGLPKKYHENWGGQMRPIYTWPTEHGTLWGLTAQIVYELLELKTDNQ